MTQPASKPTLESILDRRRLAGVAARDLTDGSGSGRPRGDDGEKAFASVWRWLLGILAGIAAVAGVVAAVVALPPVLDCRSRSEEGFYVGQTYGRCVSSGLSARWTLLEGRVKMILLRSGR